MTNKLFKIDYDEIRGFLLLVDTQVRLLEKIADFKKEGDKELAEDLKPLLKQVIDFKDKIINDELPE